MRVVNAICLAIAISGAAAQRRRNKKEGKSKINWKAKTHNENLQNLQRNLNEVKTAKGIPIDDRTNEEKDKELTLAVQQAMVQNIIQGNFTMSILRESITRARGHARSGKLQSVYSDEFLTIFERMAEDQIFNKKRRIPELEMQHLMQTRSSRGNCRNGGIGCSSYFDIDAIWGYGCYCLFGSEWRKAHGKPVNQVDGMCQKLHHCYKCAKIDAAEEGDSCDPSVESYSAPIVKDIDDQGIWVSCETGPNMGDNCKIRTCCCDIMFAQGLLDIFFSGVVFDPSLKHDMGWDFEANCPKPVCTDPSGFCPAPHKECCGEYPERFPFAPRDGERACCVNKTYKTLVLECCADGSTKKIGQC